MQAETNSGADTPSATVKTVWPDPRFTVGRLLWRDDFRDPRLAAWTSELEGGGSVTGGGGRLSVDIPKGGTVWFRPEMDGPILIQYEAVAVQHGGANDRVSDLNCFWMAQDPGRPDALLKTLRSGKFADYDALCTYYVGLGGNSNTTTRFRRYIGRPGDRPLRPEDDLRAPAYLLRPNVPQKIRLVACGGLIQYYRDEQRYFELSDPAPYTRGWFGLRTVTSHLEIRDFRVYRLKPNQRL